MNDKNSEETEKEQPQRTIVEAEVHKGSWPGWIWAVPVAAVVVVLWLTLRAVSSSGVDVTVTFNQAAGMTADSTSVMYRGLQVGTVESVQLDANGQHVVADLDIDDSVEKYLTTGTRFYLRGAHPSLSDPSSLKALISGPTIVMVPGKGKAARHYVGIETQPPQPFVATTAYRLNFSGAVGALNIGAPVTLRGFTVGDVTGVSLRVNARTGKITTPVTIALDPTRFHIQGGQANGGNWTPVMNATLEKLVQRGLRATLDQSPPLIGALQVVLKTMPGAPSAQLDTHTTPPVIPVVSSNALGGLVTKLGRLPIGQIGANVRAITARLKLLVNSPRIQDSLDHLDRTLAGLDKTVHTAGPQVAPTLKELRQTIKSLRGTAAQIDATAKTTRHLMGGGAAAPNGNLQQALRELTQAARAMRSLANYLDQHPEALLRGRSQ